MPRLLFRSITYGRLSRSLAQQQQRAPRTQERQRALNLSPPPRDRRHSTLYMRVCMYVCVCVCVFVCVALLQRFRDRPTPPPPLQPDTEKSRGLFRRDFSAGARTLMLHHRYIYIYRYITLPPPTQHCYRPDRRASRKFRVFVSFYTYIHRYTYAIHTSKHTNIIAYSSRACAGKKGRHENVDDEEERARARDRCGAPPPFAGLEESPEARALSPI